MCTREQIQRIRRAQREAMARCNRAHMLVGGRTAYSSVRYRSMERAVQRILQLQSPDMESVAATLGQMKVYLSIQHLAVRCGASNTAPLVSRRAAVVGSEPPIWISELFFQGSSDGEIFEAQVRTLVHEAAHLAGIGESNGESYIIDFDGIQTAQGGEHSADNWSHLVHVLSRQPLDRTGSWQTRY